MNLIGYICSVQVIPVFICFILFRKGGNFFRLPLFLYISLMNINQKGCFAEYKFATMAIENGFNVSMPLLDASTYDCILEKNNKLHKVQVKFMCANRYTSEKQKTPQIEIKNGKGYYSISDVDFFAVWHDEHKGFFILNNTGQRAYRLCLNNKYKDNFNNFDIIL